VAHVLNLNLMLTLKVSLCNCVCAVQATKDGKPTHTNPQLTGIALHPRPALLANTNDGKDNPQDHRPKEDVSPNYTVATSENHLNYSHEPQQ
jgi:hypothetical protein